MQRRIIDDGELRFIYQHPQLKYRTVVAPDRTGPWTVNESTIKTRIRLASQEVVVLGLNRGRSDASGAPPFTDADAREQHLREWRDRLTRVTVPAEPPRGTHSERKCPGLRIVSVSRGGARRVADTPSRHAAYPRCLVATRSQRGGRPHIWIAVNHSTRA